MPPCPGMAIWGRIPVSALPAYVLGQLLGAGVAGGQSLGGLDSNGLGRPIDLDSGRISDSGTALTGAHLGATLMALGGLDPAEIVSDTLPIGAALSG